MTLKVSVLLNALELK